MSLKKSAKNKVKEQTDLKWENEVAKLKREVERHRRLAAAADMRAKEAEQQIRDFHNSRFEISKQKVRKAKSRRAIRRVVFGDTHGCSLDPKAWSAMLQDIERLQPSSVIHGGDVLDCDGFLSTHLPMYVAQTSYSYADEIVAANIMFDQLHEVAPKAEIEVIEGNHDARPELFCVTQASRHKLDAQFLLDAIGPKQQLNIEKRGIKWWSRSECHDDAVAGGTIKRDNCYFTHPQRIAGKTAARRLLGSFKKNVVYFHVHHRNYYSDSNIQGEEWGAWCPGCMCVKRKYWHHSDHFAHNQGYHLQLVHPDGSFLGINVPIIDGKSYLSDLIKL